MPRKADIIAEETAPNNSPLRRSTRRLPTNPTAPDVVKTPKTRRASLSQENQDPKEKEKAESKPATRGRRASASKEETEPKPQPAKPRSRRSSAASEPPVDEEPPKPQTTTRRRRSSAAEPPPEPEAIKPVRSRRSSASDKPTEEEPVKKTTTRSRRSSLVEEQPKEEPAKKTTRGRRSSVDKADEPDQKEKKTTTRGRRSSTEELDKETEPKNVKLTPIKSRRRLSVTENTVNLEPIEEIDSEVKGRNSSSPVVKEAVVSLCPVKDSKVEVKSSLNLSVINETSFVEAEEDKCDSTPRRSPRLSKQGSAEKSAGSKSSPLSTKIVNMEENQSPSQHTNTEDVKVTEENKPKSPARKLNLDEEEPKTEQKSSTEFEEQLEKNEDQQKKDEEIGKSSEKDLSKVEEDSEDTTNMGSNEQNSQPPPKVENDEEIGTSSEKDLSKVEDSEDTTNMESNEALNEVKESKEALNEVKENKEVTKEDSDEIKESKEAMDKQIKDSTEVGHCNISIGSDDSFKFHLNVSIPTSQNESLQEKEDLNSSKTSNASDKENIDIEAQSSPSAKTTEVQKEKILGDLTKMNEKIVPQQEVVVARVSNVFRPRMKENSFMEPMEVDEYPSMLNIEDTNLEKSTLEDNPTVSTPITNQSFKSVDLKDKPINKNLQKDSFMGKECDSVGESFYLQLSNGPDSQEEGEETGNTSQDVRINSEEGKIDSKEENANSMEQAEENSKQNQDEIETVEDGQDVAPKDTETNHEVQTTDELDLEQSKDEENASHQTEPCNGSSPKPSEESEPTTSRNSKSPSREPTEEGKDSLDSKEKRRSVSPSFILLRGSNTDSDGDIDKTELSEKGIKTRRSKDSSRKSRSPQPPSKIEEKQIEIKIQDTSSTDKNKLVPEVDSKLRRSTSPHSSKKKRKSKSPQTEKKVPLRKSKSPQPNKEDVDGEHIDNDERVEMRRKSRSPLPQQEPKRSSLEKATDVGEEESIEEVKSRKSKSQLTKKDRRSKSPHPQDDMGTEKRSSLRKSKSPISKNLRNESPVEEKTQSSQSSEEKLTQSNLDEEKKMNENIAYLINTGKQMYDMISPIKSVGEEEEPSASPLKTERETNETSSLKTPKEKIKPTETVKSPIEADEGESGQSSMEEDKTVVENIKISKSLLLKKEFETTDSPSSQNLKIRNEVEIKRRRSKSPDTRSSKELQLEEEQDQPVVVEKIKETKREVVSPDKRSEEVEDSEQVRQDSEQDTTQEQHVPEDLAPPRCKDSVKSDRSEDYDFEVPSDEEDAEVTHVLECDQSTLEGVTNETETKKSDGVEQKKEVDSRPENCDILDDAVNLSPDSKKQTSSSNVEESETVEKESVPMEELDNDDVFENAENQTHNESANDEIEEENEGPVTDDYSQKSKTCSDEDLSSISPSKESKCEEENVEDQSISSEKSKKEQSENDEDQINCSDMESPKAKLKVRKYSFKKKMDSYEKELERTKEERQDSEESSENETHKKKRSRRRHVISKDLIDEDVGSSGDEKVVESKSPKKKLPLKRKSNQNVQSEIEFKKRKKSKEPSMEDYEDEIVEEAQDYTKNTLQKKNKIARQEQEPDAVFSDISDYENTSKLDETTDSTEKNKKSAKKNKEKHKSKSGKEKLQKTSDDQESPKKSPSSKLDEFLSRKMEEMGNDEKSDSEESDREEPNEYISTMAEEGEEDTPSEDSNAIIDEGESINSTDSEYGTDDDYDQNDSFICDEEEIELLSGEEYDLGHEKKKKKKSRIIQLDNFEDDVIKIQKKEKVVTPVKKRFRIITVSDSSESEDKEEDDDSEAKLETSRETKDSEEIICIEEKTDEEVFIEETKPTETIWHPNTSHQDSEKKKLSSITIHENIDVKQIKDSPLSERISTIVDSFCTTMRKGEISMNLSIECSAKDSDMEQGETEQKQSKKSKRSSSSSAHLDTVDSEEDEASPRRLSISMDNIQASAESKRLARKKRRLSKSMDHLDQIGRETKKRKVNKKTEDKKKKKKSRNDSPSKRELKIQSFGLINQLITDVKNRPRRIVKPSTAMNNSWIMEETYVRPSTSSFDREEKAAFDRGQKTYKAGKIHPKDFRSQMLSDPSRVRRVDSKTLLKKKGVYL